MHDLRVEARFKNAVLYNAITEALGENWTMRAAADYCGVAYQDFCALLTLREGPTRRSSARGQQDVRTWRKAALKLAAALGQPPEALFPHSLYALALPDVVVREYESEQILTLQEARIQNLLPAVMPDQEEKIFHAEAQSALHGALLTLSPREEKIIKMRFGLQDGSEHTLEQIGQYFGVTRERIREIEYKALCKLRHPSRSESLKEYEKYL